MRLLVILAFVLTAIAARGEVVERAEAESVENFVQRLGPKDGNLAHPVIETDAWHLQRKAILAFYGHEANIDVAGDQYYVVDGVAYLPLEGATYQRIPIGRIEHDGGDPEIISVFFANANGEPEKELIVLGRWEQRHYDFSGACYGTLIYAKPKETSSESFKYLEEISRKVSGSCEITYRNGTKKHSQFKTSTEVKTALRKLGYE